MRCFFKWLLISISGLTVIAVILVLSGWLYVTTSFDSPGPLREGRTVILESGIGTWKIADKLADTGIIKDPILFSVGVWLESKDQSLQAGEYAFRALATPRDVMEALSTGATVVRRVTILEGMTIADAIERLNSAEGLVGNVMENLEEGSILPETYYYELGESRATLVARMQRSMDTMLLDLWEHRDNGLPIDDLQQAVVLASIVEKETAIPEERPLIAAVFLNRLRKGMRLQSDPTVIYALTQGKGPLGRPLSRRDLRTDSPHNTYRQKGLPPTPIGNPGREAIEAVLHPDKTSAVYFVANGTGGHAFADTLVDHNRNVARWRALQENK